MVASSVPEHICVRAARPPHVHDIPADLTLFLQRAVLQGIVLAAESWKCAGAQEEPEEAGMDDVRKIQVMRNQIVKWLDEPFLGSTMVGAMVRISMPQGYILAEVLSVEETNINTLCAPSTHPLCLHPPFHEARCSACMQPMSSLTSQLGLAAKSTGRMGFLSEYISTVLSSLLCCARERDPCKARRLIGF